MEKKSIDNYRHKLRSGSGSILSVNRRQGNMFSTFWILDEAEVAAQLVAMKDKMKQQLVIDKPSPEFRFLSE